MNHYTTIEQSKHLLELGLKAETADACYDVGDGQTKAHIECENFISYFTNDEFPELKDRYIPCWSVGALLELMPKIKNSDKVYYPYLGLNRDGNFICVYRFNDNDWHWYITNNVVEVCYQMIVWLLQNNYIKTE